MSSSVLRIIQITGSDVGGGAESVVRQHHQELSRQGHQVQLLVGRKQTDDPATTQIPFRRGPKGVLRTARWLQRTSGLQNLYSPGFRAIEDSFAFTPDILHFHSLHGVDSFAELSVVRRLSRKYPTVVSMHDLWLMTGHCGHPLSCPKWKTGCGNCPDLLLYPAVSRDATRWNFRSKRRAFREAAVQLVVPSDWLRIQVQQSPVLKHLPISVIENPVDTQTFCPGDATAFRAAHGIDPAERTVILVAQHLQNPFKGIEDGIKVLNDITTKNVKVILVGNAATDVANRLSLPTLVLPFTTSKDELANYYRMADLLLMPSRGETFGLVAAEAMACGTPVVAFHVGGLPEVIGGDTTGVVIEERDHTAMTRAIDDFLADDAKLARVSASASQRINQQFTLPRHSGRTLNLYEQILAGREIGVAAQIDG